MLYTEENIALIKESSLLVGKTLAEVAKFMEVGVQTLVLDKIAEDFIRKNNAIPGFKDYQGFPFTLCISVNDTVVHGFPSEYTLKEGDLVSIDCGVLKNGFYGDSAYTFAIGEVSPEIRALMETTKLCLEKGIEQAIAGNRIGDIGFAVQTLAESHGYGVVRELIGHGVGKNLHEKPDVPNYGKRGNGSLLKEAMVIAIEPMITLGKRNVKMDKNGWGIRTADGKWAAHYEHDVVVRKHKAEVLSSFEEIENVIKEKK